MLYKDRSNFKTANRWNWDQLSKIFVDTLDNILWHFVNQTQPNVIHIHNRQIEETEQGTLGVTDSKGILTQIG